MLSRHSAVSKTDQYLSADPKSTPMQPRWHFLAGNAHRMITSGGVFQWGMPVEEAAILAVFGWLFADQRIKIRKKLTYPIIKLIKSSIALVAINVIEKEPPQDDSAAFVNVLATVTLMQEVVNNKRIMAQGLRNKRVFWSAKFH